VIAAAAEESHAFEIPILVCLINLIAHMEEKKSTQEMFQQEPPVHFSIHLSPEISRI